MAAQIDPETLLDDPDELARRDSSGLLRATAMAGSLVRQVSHAVAETALSAELPDRARSLVLCGHGEAASAARALRALAGPEVAAPAVVHDDLDAPQWLSVGDVVLALSRTGDDEHSLRTAQMALRRGCALFSIAPEGSPLAVLAAGERSPYVPIPPDTVDGAALWGQMALGVHVLSGMHQQEPHEATLRVSRLADVLDEISTTNGPLTPYQQSPAKILALETQHANILLAADSSVGLAAADRFSVRMLTCVGLPSQVLSLPGGMGMVASALTGPWVGPERDIFFDPYDDDSGDAPGRPLRIVLFSESSDPAARHHLRQLCDTHRVGLSVVAAEGEEAVHRLASLMQIGDLATAYLSVLSGRSVVGSAYP